MSTSRFHKAAKEGLLEVLKEATKRDCNARDEQGMTPTLYAAFHGQLDSLRLLCGRGGEPDKADYFGNTALHLAAAQGHKHIVTFLINFGINIFAMDIDERTAQELAGMNDREDILRILDAYAGKLESTDKKKSKSLREKARKEYEKRIKEFHKRQNKLDVISQERIQKKPFARTSMISTLKSKMKSSGSLTNLHQVDYTAPKNNTFSALVSGNNNGTMHKKNVMGTVQRKALANRFRNNNLGDDDFKVSEIEDGKRSVRSLKGLRRDSEVLYGGALDSNHSSRTIEGVFNEAETALDNAIKCGAPLIRSKSQPDFMQDLNEPGSIFVRPGIGSLAFRKSLSNTMQAMSFAEAGVDVSSIGSARFDDDDDLSACEESSEDDSASSAMERFLTAWGLGEYLSRFDDQKIDLDTLMILTETDLKTLELPLGPYRKLVIAINERKSALENPGEVTDGML